jgi:integrase
LFEQFVKERRYLKAVSPKTVIWYDTAWKAYKASQTTLDERGGLTLTKQGPQVFVVHLGDRGVKPRSVNTYLQVMNAFSRWLHAEGHATELLRIARWKTEKKILVTFTDPQLRQLLGFKPRTFNQWRIYVLVATILDTGSRIDEVIKLPVSQVDLDNLLLTVNGKGSEERKIPFSFELRKLLFRYGQFKDKHGVGSWLMFSSRRGTVWGHRNALMSYYILLGRVGLPKSGFHRLRRTFATQYRRKWDSRRCNTSRWGLFPLLFP